MKQWQRELQTFGIAEYIIDNKATVRMAAAKFGLSKSAIYDRMTRLLPELDIVLACKVEDVFKYNLQQRSKRGGYASKCKYERIKQRIERDER